jgi:hypothetical protein
MPDTTAQLIDDLVDILGRIQLEAERAAARAARLEDGIRTHRQQVLAEHLIVQQPQDTDLWKLLDPKDPT